MSSFAQATASSNPKTVIRRSGQHGSADNLPLCPSLAARIADLPPPVIIFNKSHSGSRLLAAMLQSQGLFIGSELNESLDALPFVPLVEHTVLQFYPGFQALWQLPEWPQDIQGLLGQALDEHLAGHVKGTAWGWKLCETAYILPLLARLFPNGRFIHLIRDGRDVAYSDHVAPERPFWRKVYFGTAAIESWKGMRLDQAAYERQPHLFNAHHWQESVRIGCSFGAMLGPTYREMHYENLCSNFIGESTALLRWLAIEPKDAALVDFAARVNLGRAGKYRRQPRAKQRAVQTLIEPTLFACGYACDPLPYSLQDSFASLWQRLRRKIRRHLRAERRD